MASASELYRSGVASLNAGQFDQAVAHFKSAAELEPSAQMFFALGRAQEAAGRSADA
jgi:outer membrane protein assembly factor BamD (BamD/ComL family)